MPRTVLWDKVEVAMPFDQAKALYPQAHVHTGKGLFQPMLSIADHKIGECSASVEILIDRKVAEPGAKVKSVRLSGDGCDARMLTGLISTYGAPLAINDNNEKGSKKARWTSEGRVIVYKSEKGKGWAPDYWEITYEPIQDLGL